jgi:hypothetical protein
MEVNGYWNDRGAPERIDKVNAETDAGQMEQPVQDGNRNQSTTEAREWEQPFAGQKDHRPPD